MQQEAGCFAFVDMDNLKRINDSLGHESGDKALHLLGETLSACAGENGLCCRLGGDEFLLFLPGVSRETAEKQIRIIISKFNENKAADPVTSIATLSAGLVMCTPSDAYLTAYNRADKALYHVKQNGKNDYSFFNEESELDTTDVNRLVPGIRTAGRYSGGLNVEYRHFTRLYDFIENLESRFSQPFKLVLITLTPAEGTGIHIEEQEKAMYYMEQAIRQTIRGVDVLTRYSSRQYLVILVGAKAEGVQGAVDRIFRGYYKMNGSGSFMPGFTVADPEEAKERGTL
jgi:diguanylate cyclase (GGDEF)-like protein